MLIISLGGSGTSLVPRVLLAEVHTHWVSHELLQVHLLLVESGLPPPRCPLLLLLVLTHNLAQMLS